MRALYVSVYKSGEGDHDIMEQQRASAADGERFSQILISNPCSRSPLVLPQRRGPSLERKTEEPEVTARSGSPVIKPIKGGLVNLPLRRVTGRSGK